MSLSWKLGRVAGIDLYLHASALLLFVIVGNFLPTAFENALFVTGLLGSIILHELGHALMARSYGIQTGDITLYVFGGVARLERMPRSSGPELLITLAGPAVNFAIVAALGLLIGLADAVSLPMPELVRAICFMNLYLGIFNLLPVFPMDGGRIVRALLSNWVGRLKATEAAVSLGRVLAVVIGVLSLMNGRFDGIILAIFVYVVGSMELAQVRSEGRQPGMVDGFVNIPDPPAGFRWVNGGDGVMRLVPIMIHAQARVRPWN